MQLQKTSAFDSIGPVSEPVTVRIIIGLAGLFGKAAVVTSPFWAWVFF